MNQAELFTEAPSRSRHDPDFLFELRFGLITIRAWKGPVLEPSSLVRMDLDCTYRGREVYKRGETWIAAHPDTLGCSLDKGRAANHILRVPDALWSHASSAQREFADSKAADAARDACDLRSRKGWR